MKEKNNKKLSLEDMPYAKDIERESKLSQLREESYFKTIFVSYPICFLLYLFTCYAIHSSTITTEDAFILSLKVLALTLIIDFIRIKIAKDTIKGFLNSSSSWCYITGHRIPFVILALSISLKDDLMLVIMNTSIYLLIYYLTLSISTLCIEMLKYKRITKSFASKDQMLPGLLAVTSIFLLLGNITYTSLITVIVFLI